MIVKDYQQLSIVTEGGFLTMMEIVILEYKVQSQNTIRSRIDKLYGEQKGNLIKKLKNEQSVSLTTDTWTSTSNDSY